MKLEELKEQLDTAMSSQNPDESIIQQINKELLISYKKEEEFWK